MPKVRINAQGQCPRPEFIPRSELTPEVRAIVHVDPELTQPDLFLFTPNVAALHIWTHSIKTDKVPTEHKKF